MSILLTVVAPFLVNYCYIMLKAWQQLNVVHNNYYWILPTSMCMAAGEVFIMSRIVHTGFMWTFVAAGGLGAGLGALTAMHLHKRMGLNGAKKENIQATT